MVVLAKTGEEGYWGGRAFNEEKHESEDLPDVTQYKTVWLLTILLAILLKLGYLKNLLRMCS